MHLILKILTPLFLLGCLKAISQIFYIGVITGIVFTFGAQYYLFTLYLKEKNKNSTVTIDFALTEFKELIVDGPQKAIKQDVGKRKHYANKFSKRLTLDLTNFHAQIDMEQNELQKNQQIEDEHKDSEQKLLLEGDLFVKVNRKDFLKKIDLYQQFNDQVKELEQYHGQSLHDFNGLSVIFTKQFEQSTLNLVDNTIDHTISIEDISQYGSQLIEKIAEISLDKNHQLLLPSWKSFKLQINRIGKCHLDLSKNLSSMITEQIQVLRKEYNSEIEDLKKEKLKLISESQEISTTLSKVVVDNNALDKDLKYQVGLYSDMNKKREDPSNLIKQEMKVKLALSLMDSMKQKLFNAKENNRDLSSRISKLNSKIIQSEIQWEEQRLVYLKQGLQNQLIGFEDLSQQVQQLVSNFICVIDKDKIVYPPENQAYKKKTPKLYLEFAEECYTLEVIQKSSQYLTFTDETLTRWNLLLKYDDDVEYFIRELKNINDRHTHSLEFDSKGTSVLWETISHGTSEIIKISVKSIFQGLCGLKEIYKDFSTQLEKRRTELNKLKADNAQIGRELEQCLIRDAKKLSALMNEERVLNRYNEDKRSSSYVDEDRLLQQEDELKDQSIPDLSNFKDKESQGIKNYYDKQKNLAKHFLKEVKSNMKNVSSIGQLVTQVGQTVQSISKVSHYSTKQYLEKQESIHKQCDTLFVVMGFTLKNMDELMLKHHRIISREKKNVLLDFCALATNLNTHFRKIIDEMSFRIKETQMNKESSMTEEQKKNITSPQVSAKSPPQRIDSNSKFVFNQQEVYSLDTGEAEKEDDFSNKDVRLIDKLLKVLFSEWSDNTYFKSKLQKIIYKSLNKKRPSMLDELVITDMQIQSDTVELMGLQPQKQDDQEWLCDMDLHFKGVIELHIETKIIINWPKENYARLPVKINVLIKSFNGTMRVCLVPIRLGKSWISFMGDPVVNIQIIPILADYNIANIPSVTEIMRELIHQKIKLLTFPNKCTIDVPMSAASKKLPKSVIPQ